MQKLGKKSDKMHENLIGKPMKDAKPNLSSLHEYITH